MADIYYPKVYDKVFYTGEDKRYLYRLFTITSIDATVQPEPSIITLEYQREGSELISFQTNRADLLTFCYNGAPKFTQFSTVYSVIGGDPVQGQVIERDISLSEMPNIYKVAFVNGETNFVREGDLFQFDPTKLADSTVITLEHINYVRNLLQTIAIQLLNRGEAHDASKLGPQEKPFLDAMQYLINNEGNAPYGSEEYKRRTAILKPMLRHHYSNNSHHPEHYEGGINGMTLMDVVEMFADWFAASQRGQENAVNLTHAADRYVMSDQLKRIFSNTYRALGLPYK